jgi:streptomycin 6-kinase
MPSFDALSYNYVAPARRADGSAAVLKMGVPNPELTGEILALQTYDGRGVVRLLEQDIEQGVFLLARVQPGNPLSGLEDDDEATRILATTMRKMWQPLPANHPFQDVAEWARGLQRLRPTFGGETGPFSEVLVDKAVGLFEELFASAGEPVLLHGDLHHENVLRAGPDSWLVIDPKGMAGERAYEVGALLHNPWGKLTVWYDLPSILSRRVSILSEILEIDRQRIIAHGLAQAVLSGWWMYEDHGHGWEPMMRCAEAMSRLLRE